MTKQAFVPVISLILLFMIGCRSSTPVFPMTPSQTAHTSQPLTAFEAYERVRQSIQGWHEDAVVVFIFASGHNVAPDGKSLRWGFTIESPSLMRRTEVFWIGGKIRRGIPDIVGGEVDIYNLEEGLPLDEMIDSNEAVQIAAKVINNTDANDTLIDIRTERSDLVSHRVISPSWRLTYGDPDDIHDIHSWRMILVNALTGEVLHNDFNPPPPTATPVRPPAPDQLLIRAYGEFDLYITNPWGQSLGIEPNSDEQIAEIPDAWYEIDSDIMAEDDVRLASALIANPVEGRYRVQVHGPGEPEKRCRLSVEVRTGAGEEALREVEIPCREGVSQVYEFTLSLSGGELLSDIVLVPE